MNKAEIEVPLLEIPPMESEPELLVIENKMDPLVNDPIVEEDKCFGFSQEVANHPSEQKNGCKNLNSQSTGCDAPSSQTEVGGQQQLKDVNTEEQDEFWLTDGTPYFHFILGKSHLANPYNLVVPAKMQQILPAKEVPVILACGNKSWKMNYGGHHRTHKRLETNWKQFLVDNKLKLGDGCVFGLLECSEALIKFNVKILSGDIPAEFLDRVDGTSSKNPIVLD